MPRSWDKAFFLQQLALFDKATKAPRADLLYFDWKTARSVAALSKGRDTFEQATLYAVAASLINATSNEQLSLCWDNLDKPSRIVIDIINFNDQ